MVNETKTEIKLGNRVINSGSAPYIIAEIGVNHEGSLERAKELIDLAKAGGADAAKFQTYKAELLASKDSPSYWDLNSEKTKSQFELFKKLDSFGPRDYEALAEHCAKREIDFCSTPFDLGAVEMLNPLVPFFKIASADITNLPLLRSVAETRKQVVLSTGAATLEEVGFALRELTDHGCPNVCLMHCVLNYPTPNDAANLWMINALKEAFPSSFIGYSDHTVPSENMEVVTTAIILGALVIEKHFTDNKAQIGNDHYHSMDVHDLQKLNKNIKAFMSTRGDVGSNDYAKSEEVARTNARRSLYFSKPMAKGDEITVDDLICKRPGHGVSPIHWDDIIGKSLNNDVDEGQMLSLEMLKVIS